MQQLDPVLSWLSQQEQPTWAMRIVGEIRNNDLNQSCISFQTSLPHEGWQGAAGSCVTTTSAASLTEDRKGEWPRSTGI